MFAETGLLFPYYYQNFYIDNQALDFWNTPKATDLMSLSPSLSSVSRMNPVSRQSSASSIFEYDLGAEGDLFEAPKEIIEEPMIGLDPITSAISIISAGEDIISTKTPTVAEIESVQNEQLLSEVFCEFKKDLLANEASGTSISEVLQIQIPVAADEIPFAEEKVLPQEILPKSVSSECLSSMEWINGMRPNFLDFPGMDFGEVYEMRRSLSEGDIKTLGNGCVSTIQSPLGQQHLLGNCSIEDRKEKLSRYRNKKTKRNFGRKIKYACRKALADSQPRIRGRFAKTEESDVSKKCNSLQ